jgi:hypothetical protein
MNSTTSTRRCGSMRSPWPVVATGSSRCTLTTLVTPIPGTGVISTSNGICDSSLLEVRYFYYQFFSLFRSRSKQGPASFWWSRSRKAMRLHLWRFRPTPEVQLNRLKKNTITNAVFHY